MVINYFYIVCISVAISVVISLFLVDNIIIRNFTESLKILLSVQNKVSNIESRVLKLEVGPDFEDKKKSIEDDLAKIAQSVTTFQRLEMKPDRDGKVVFDIDTGEYFAWYDGEFKKVCYEN
jgi:hypothetical protein